MRFSDKNETMFRGENNAKFIVIEDIEEEYLDCDIYVEFVTPTGKFYITEKLEVSEDRTITIPVTANLTNKAGWLICQPVITRNGNEFIERKDIKKYYISYSTDGEPGEDVEYGLIYKMDSTKADNIVYKDYKLSLMANGKKIGQEIDLSNIEQENKIQFASRLNFPNVGKENLIYVDLESNDLYVWNSQKLTYMCVARDYSKLNTINGGNA